MKDRILTYLYKHPGAKASEIAKALLGDRTETRLINQCLTYEIPHLVEREGIYGGYHLNQKGMEQVRPIPSNHGKAWEPETIALLESLVNMGYTTDVIAEKMGRSVRSIEMKMETLGLSIAASIFPQQASVSELVEQVTVIAEAVSEPEPQITLSNDQKELADQIIQVITYANGSGIRTSKIALDCYMFKDEVLPILDILLSQGVLRRDRINDLWYLQDRGKISVKDESPSVSGSKEESADEMPEEQKVQESLVDIVSRSVEKLKVLAALRLKDYVAARYRITRNDICQAFWLSTNVSMPIGAIKDKDNRLVYKNSLMGIYLQTTNAGDEFTYHAIKGLMFNHVHNTHIFHMREINMENEPKPYVYRSFVSLQEYLDSLRKTQNAYEEKVEEIKKAEEARKNVELDAIEKGKLTRQINKMKEEKRQLAGQRDDLIRLSNYIREQGKLRYNPVLDPIQTKIKSDFLYDGTTLVIDGGPGTGKTTTMIQRLKYLTDIYAIEEDAKDIANGGRFKLSQGQREDLIERIENNRDWMFFSPSQLLKSYLADAMNREGLSDTNNKVTDWSEFRKAMMRRYGFFGVGKRVQFIDCPTESGELIYSNAAPRITFIKFLREAICKEVALLPKVTGSLTAGMSMNAQRIISALAGIENDTLKGLIGRLNRMQDIILEKTIDVEAEIEELSIEMYAMILQDEKIANELRNFKLPESDVEQEFSSDFEDAELRANIKNWLSAFCYNRYYSQEKLADEYVLMQLVLGPLVDKIDANRLNRIGEGLLYEKYHIFTKGVEKLILRRIPKFYKEFRQYVVKQNLNEDWNVELLSKILKQNKKQLHFQEQSLLLLIVNDLIKVINQVNPNNTIKHKYMLAYKEYVRPIIGIDEVTDFSEVEIQAMLSFVLPEYNSVTLAGDLMQRLTVGGIKDWDELNNVINSPKIIELRTSYRQSKAMLAVAQNLYEDTIGVSPKYKAKLQESKVPKPLLIISDSEEKKLNWIESRIEDVYNAYSQTLPAIAIFINHKEDVSPFVEKMRSSEFFINAGIDIVDGSEGNVLGSRHQIRVYPISVVKGMEFDVVFFHNIDSSGFDDDTIKRYIYVGVSRAAFFLGATMSKDLPEISKYFSKGKNWRTFMEDE